MSESDRDIEMKKLRALAEEWSVAEAPTEGDPMKVLLVTLITAKVRVLAEGVLDLTTRLAAAERVVEAANRGHESDGVSTAMHWFDPPSTDDPHCTLCAALRSVLTQERDREET